MAAADDVYEWLNEQGDPGDSSYEVADQAIEELGDLGVKRKSVASYVRRWRDWQEEAKEEAREAEDKEDEDERTIEEKLDDETPNTTTFWSDFQGSGAIPDPEGGAYHIYIPGKGPKTVPAPAYEEMKKRYSNWTGDWDIITEICRDFGIDYSDFKTFKRAAGWTHHSSPWPDDVLLDTDTGDLLDDLARQKERKVYSEWQKRQQKENARKAEKWDKFEKTVAEPIYKRIKATPIEGEKTTIPNKDRDAFYAMPHPVDGHVDQKNADQSGYETNRRRHLDCLADNLSDIDRYCTPKKLVVNVGNDLGNIDSMFKTTAAGTDQDQDLVGPEAVFEVYDTGLEAIEMCRELGVPVEVRVVPGNHDWRTMVSYYWALEMKYADIPDVDIVGGARRMQFNRYGKNICVWLHGDNISGGETKQNWNLSAQILQNASHLLDNNPTHFYALMGHNHSILEKDDGVHTLQGGSTAKTDDWHRVNQYETSKACQTAYVMAEEGGQVARFTAYPD